MPNFRCPLLVYILDHGSSAHFEGYGYRQVLRGLHGAFTADSKESKKHLTSHANGFGAELAIRIESERHLFFLFSSFSFSPKYFLLLFLLLFAKREVCKPASQWTGLEVVSVLQIAEPN